MNLYLVKRKNLVGEDECQSFIIACENEEIARHTHPYNESHWGMKFDPWISSSCIDDLEVIYLGKADSSIKKGIITYSFGSGMDKFDQIAYSYSY